MSDSIDIHLEENIIFLWCYKEFGINHLLFMNDLKLFAQDQDHLDSLVQTVYFFGEDTGMEFAVKKCGLLLAKKEKVVRVNGTAPLNGQMMREFMKEDANIQVLQKWIRANGHKRKLCKQI